jgi:hypothetical protein
MANGHIKHRVPDLNQQMTYDHDTLTNYFTLQDPNVLLTCIDLWTNCRSRLPRAFGLRWWVPHTACPRVHSTSWRSVDREEHTQRRDAAACGKGAGHCSQRRPTVAAAEGGAQLFTRRVRPCSDSCCCCCPLLRIVTCHCNILLPSPPLPPSRPVLLLPLLSWRSLRSLMAAWPELRTSAASSVRTPCKR